MDFTIYAHGPGEYISDWIRQNNCWEPEIHEILRELFDQSPNVIFVDIGSNIGYFSLLSASRKVKTISFEPISANFSLFEESIKKNSYQDLITLHKIGLSDVSGTGSFKIYKSNMGMCSSRDFSGFQQEEQVDLKTFDELYTYNFPGTFIIKIDAEHMELNVLKGMEKNLHRVSHLIIEISKTSDTHDIFLLLKHHGFLHGLLIDSSYIGRRLLKNTNHLSKPFVPIDDIEKYFVDQINVLFLHSRRYLPII